MNTMARFGGLAQISGSSIWGTGGIASVESSLPPRNRMDVDVVDGAVEMVVVWHVVWGMDAFSSEEDGEVLDVDQA